MKNNIQKLILVVAAFVGLGTQIGCKGVYYGVFEEPTILEVDENNTLEINNEDLNFESDVIGEFSLYIFNAEFPIADLNKDRGKRIERQYQYVQDYGWEPNIFWSGTIVLDPIEIIQDPDPNNINYTYGRGTLVKYVFHVDLTSATERLKFSGIVNAKVEWSSND